MGTPVGVQVPPPTPSVPGIKPVQDIHPSLVQTSACLQGGSPFDKDYYGNRESER